MNKFLIYIYGSWLLQYFLMETYLAVDWYLILALMYSEVTNWTSWTVHMWGDIKSGWVPAAAFSWRMQKHIYLRQSLRPSPISHFYPLPLEKESQGVVAEIHLFEMGHPFKSAIHHEKSPMTVPDVSPASKWVSHARKCPLLWTASYGYTTWTNHITVWVSCHKLSLMV